MDPSRSIFNFDDTLRPLDRPSLGSSLDRTSTIPSRNSPEPGLSHSPQRHLGSLNQKLNVKRELSGLKASRFETPKINKGFNCSEIDGPKCSLNGQPILFTSYLPAWERPPVVSQECFMKSSLKRLKDIDPDNLKPSKKFCPLKPKMVLEKTSCLALAASLRSGALGHDIALLLNPKLKVTSDSNKTDASIPNNDFMGVNTASALKHKQFYTPEVLSRVWAQKLKSIPGETLSDVAKSFPKVVCSVQFFSDQADKDELRQAKLRFLHRKPSGR